MTIGERVMHLDGKDLRTVDLKRGDVIKLERRFGVVTETAFEEVHNETGKSRRLLRLKTLSKERGFMSENGFSVDSETGHASQFSYSRSYEKNTKIKNGKKPYVIHSSPRYAELKNNYLEVIRK